MSKKFFLPLLLLVYFSAAQVLYACSCGDSGAPCEAVWKASSVFVGTVLSNELYKSASREVFYSREVKFAVLEPFRGVTSNIISIYTGSGGGDCGYSFEVGRQYLVYAYKNSKDERLGTSICTRTRPLTDANEDLNYLRNLSLAQSSSTILGQVHRRNSDSSVNEPMHAARIVVESSDKKLEVITDEKGRFAAKGLVAGTYKVSIVLSEGLTAGKNEHSVTVEDQGCASVYFAVQSDGRLNGHVLNSSGQPVAKAEISIFTENKKRYQGHRVMQLTDDQGAYKFNQIPPGRYKLLIRFDGLRSHTRPFPSIYHPGVPDVSQATVIEIGDGQEIKDYNLIVPDLPREREIEGVVVSPEGAIISDARVRYQVESTMYDITMTSPARFRVQLYEGVSARIQAYLERNGKRIQSEWVSIPATGDPGKLKLVIAAQ